MAIFSGVELLFFSLGVLSASGFGALALVQRAQRLSLKTNLAASLGLVVTLFGYAWCVSCVLEGEPQAANMGLIVFGLPGLLTLSLARRWGLEDRRHAQSAERGGAQGEA